MKNKLDLDDINLLLEALEFMKMKSENTDYPDEQLKNKRLGRIEILTEKLNKIKADK